MCTSNEVRDIKLVVRWLIRTYPYTRLSPSVVLHLLHCLITVMLTSCVILPRPMSCCSSSFRFVFCLFVFFTHLHARTRLLRPTPRPFPSCLLPVSVARFLPCSQNPDLLPFPRLLAPSASGVRNLNPAAFSFPPYPRRVLNWDASHSPSHPSLASSSPYPCHFSRTYPCGRRYNTRSRP